MIILRRKKMLQRNIKDYISIVMLFFMIFISGCVYSNSIVDSSYKVLKTTQIAYDNVMITASTLYKEDKITEKQKNKIVDLGDDFVKHYKILLFALENYSKGLESSESIEEATANFVLRSNKLMMYAREVINK